jgi:hypothetical protein
LQTANATFLHRRFFWYRKCIKNDTFCVFFCVTQRDDAMSEWIPVSERLPPEETRVLAYDGTSVFESEYMHGRWEWLADVTHWLPMPNPPKVK